MFLTPFIDFGDTVEYWLGGCFSAKEVAPNSTAVHVSERPLKPVTAVPKIIAVTGGVSRSSTKLSGSHGLAIGSGPFEQSKTYFEIIAIGDDCNVSVGAVGRHPSLLVGESVRTIAGGKNAMSIELPRLRTNDTVGVVINIGDFPPSLTVYINDTEYKSVSQPVRGDLWPVIQLNEPLGGLTSDSTSANCLTVVFDRDELKYLNEKKTQRGIDALMIARNIL